MHNIDSLDDRASDAFMKQCQPDSIAASAMNGMIGARGASADLRSCQATIKDRHAHITSGADSHGMLIVFSRGSSALLAVFSVWHAILIPTNEDTVRC
jgi:hypothetical protein